MAVGLLRMAPALAKIGKGASKSKTAKGLGSLGLLGRVGATMAIPVIGGVAGLIGGAMSLAGGVLHAGSTVAGIASRAASGVMGAAGGLAGGGQSGNVEKSEKPRVGVPAVINKTPLALSNIKSLTSPADGPVSMLPTGEESPTTLLGQILAQIRTNTALLGSMLRVMSAGATQSLIETSKKKKGEDDDPKGPGFVKRTFSDLGDKLQSLSGSLAGGAKTILKGLALGALFVLFNKYRDKIVGVVATIFETLEGWYTALKDPENPINNILDTVKDWFETDVKPILKDLTISFIKMLYTAIATMVNAILPGTFMDIDTHLDTSGMLGTPKHSYDSTTDTQLRAIAATAPDGDLGFVENSPFTPFGVKYHASGKSEGETAAIEALVKERLAFMYKNFNQSAGRIQWTNVGQGFELGGGPDSLFDSKPKITISEIMNSVPIVDGYERTLDDLNNPNLLILPFSKDSPFRDEFVQSLVKSSDWAQLVLGDSAFKDLPDGSVEKLATNRILQRKLLTDENELQAKTGVTILQEGSTQSQINTGDVVNSGTSVKSTDWPNLQWHFGGELSQ
jgi:hypothetical protein